MIAFAPKDFYILDSNLQILCQRQYATDHIDGKFSNLGISHDPSSGELILLFAGIHFTRLVPQQERATRGALCFVQVANCIQFEESVYHAIEYESGKLLVSLWHAGYLIVDKHSG